jgi:hypothetical protein
MRHFDKPTREQMGRRRQSQNRTPTRTCAHVCSVGHWSLAQVALAIDAFAQ